MDGKQNTVKRLRTAKPPEIVYVPEGTHPESAREYFDASGLAILGGREPRPGLNVAYPDRRIMPRICERTGMRREFCCCAPCRARRRRKHQAACSCWLCFADRMGAFIDSVGRKTAAGRWVYFVTLTFSTKSFPWAKRFPIEQPQPSPEFVHNFFRQMVRWLEGQLHDRVEYFTADQFGEVGGRLHQHFGLSSPSLTDYEWRPFQAFLWDKAGFNRILPWEKDASYYIGRYIGRDANRCEWDFRVGEAMVRPPAPVGRQVVARSTAIPPGGDDVQQDAARSLGYRSHFRRWHR